MNDTISDKYILKGNKMSDIEKTYHNIEKSDFISDSYTQKEVYDMLTDYRFCKSPMSYILSRLLMKFDKPNDYLQISWTLENDLMIQYKYKDFIIYKISFSRDKFAVDCSFELVNNPFFQKWSDILYKRWFLKQTDSKIINKANKKYMHNDISPSYVDGILKSFKKLVTDFENSNR